MSDDESVATTTTMMRSTPAGRHPLHPSFILRSFLRPGLFRLFCFAWHTCSVLTWLSTWSSPAARHRAMSTTASSSTRSWSLESDWPGVVNTSNDALLAAYSFETGGLLRAFWGWNGATAIWGTCHFAMLLAPTQQTLVSPISLR